MRYRGTLGGSNGNGRDGHSGGKGDAFDLGLPTGKGVGWGRAQQLNFARIIDIL